MSGPPPNGWSRAEMYVLEKLDELQTGQKDLLESVRCIDRKVAELRVKASTWGAVSGFLASLGTLIVALVLWLIQK